MKRSRDKAGTADKPSATTLPAPPVPPVNSGYSDAARHAIKETASRVEEMHRAIAGKSFDTLAQVPLVAGPAAVVRQLHDAIAGGVYAAIRHGTDGVLGAAAMIERQLPEGVDDGNPPSRMASTVKSALNAAFGDHFADTGNVMAIAMGVFVGGHAVPIDTVALDAAFPAGNGRLCLFIHGLAFDEHCWEINDGTAASDDGKQDFGQALHTDFGLTPLYLRYNTGLPIADNGARLATLLEALLAAWPEPVEELLLIGHSMGGLIARNACEQAAAAQLFWPQVTRMLICLGSPHLGSPVERLGHAVNTALNSNRITAPLGKIAEARSQGVKDLRHGPGADPTAAHGIAFRFLGSTLTDDIDHPLADWLGDGLVTLGSATEHPIVGDVQSVRLGGIAHMALTTEARVYAQIKAWLTERGDG